MAINQTLFGGQGKLVAGLNVAFLERGRYLGHFAVMLDCDGPTDVCFEASAEPVDRDHVEAWGQVDPEDPDYAASASEHGFEFTEEVAMTAALYDFDSAEEALQAMPGSGTVEHAAILRRAMAEVL